MTEETAGTISGNSVWLFLILWTVFWGGFISVITNPLRGVMPLWIYPIFLQVCSVCGVFMIIMLSVSWFLDYRESRIPQSRSEEQ